MADDRITTEELRGIFGDRMPMEAILVLTDQTITTNLARQKLRELAAPKADDLVKVLEAALRWYHDQMCEGFCKDLRHDSTYTPEMDDVCAGCKARAALEGEKT